MGTKQASKGNMLLAEIRKSILMGDIRLGQRITEEELALKFGVSRMPVRDALRDLERMGVIVRRKKGGTYLRRLSLREISEIYEVRASLESLSARRAAHDISPAAIAALEKHARLHMKAIESRDDLGADMTDLDFHKAVVVAGGNRWVIRIMESFPILERAFSIAYEISPDPANDVTVPYPHEKIIAALKDGDPERASEMVYGHIMNSREILISRFLSKPSATEEDV